MKEVDPSAPTRHHGQEETVEVWPRPPRPNYGHDAITWYYLRFYQGLRQDNAVGDFEAVLQEVARIGSESAKTAAILLLVQTAPERAEARAA